MVISLSSCIENIEANMLWEIINSIAYFLFITIFVIKISYNDNKENYYGDKYRRKNEVSNMEESYKFFTNKHCRYFPCHKGIPTEGFNCLFCYCPLYALGKVCGGNYMYLENGVKSCEKCTKPHQKDGYEHIMKHIDKVVVFAKEQC